MAYQWEMEKVKDWSTDQIRNRIYMEVSLGQPVPGCVSVDALRIELKNRGLDPVGFHNT